MIEPFSSCEIGKTWCTNKQTKIENFNIHNQIYNHLTAMNKFCFTHFVVQSFLFCELNNVLELHFHFQFCALFHNLIVNRPAQSAAVCLFCMTSSALRTEISTADIVSWLSSQLVAKNRTAPFLVEYPIYWRPQDWRLVVNSEVVNPEYINYINWRP